MAVWVAVKSGSYNHKHFDFVKTDIILFWVYKNSLMEGLMIFPFLKNIIVFNIKDEYFTAEKSAFIVIDDVSKPLHTVVGVQSVAHPVLVESIADLRVDRLEDRVLAADTSVFLSAITLSKFVSISFKALWNEMFFELCI